MLEPYTFLFHWVHIKSHIYAPIIYFYGAHTTCSTATLLSQHKLYKPEDASQWNSTYQSNKNVDDGYGDYDHDNDATAQTLQTRR